MERTTGLDEPAALRTLRRLLLALLAVVMLGTTADLFLIGHYEEWWQTAPLVVIAAGLVAVAWTAFGGGAAAVTALRAIMVVFVATGLLGILMHFQGTREFQLEMDPALSGWPLIVKIITAKAPPALAPAVMAQMGLLGLLSTYRHPALQAGSGPQPRVEDRSLR